MREKTAIPLEGVPSVVLLNNGERMTRAKAERAGYRILNAGAISAKPEQDGAADKAASWRTAILCLPEARDRASAAEEIVNTHTHHTMTVVAARAFLRGLPTERTEEQPALSTNNNSGDPRAARLAEIRGSMSAFNKNNGHGANATATAGPSLSGLDPTKLKRLAEIRLNALESGAAEASAAEAKKLRYALQVHSQTGMPLAAVFAQLGVDTSKIIRS
jgi:hypothetical protein